jgi:hypothetical protein
MIHFGLKSCVDDAGKRFIQQLWIKGDSAQVIASKMIHNYPSITRQVVVGIVSRARAAGQEWARLRTTNNRDLSCRIQRVKTTPIPPPPTIISIIHEPTFVGPQNDFPAPGHCQYTHDDPAKGFQMCGHPTGDYHDRWCQWHKDNTIYNRQQKAA